VNSAKRETATERRVRQSLTAIATTVYYRKLPRRGVWSFSQIAIFPLAAAAFLF
jgi:hypothetical protein